MNVYRIRFVLLAAAILFQIAVRPGGSFAADGSITLGTQWWDQTVNEAKYREFTDIPNGPFIGSLSVRDDLLGGRYWLLGTDLLQQDQSVSAVYRRPRWTAGIDFMQTPHNFSFVAQTPYANPELGVLTLPDTLQKTIEDSPSGYAAIMSDFLESARRQELGFRTDNLRGNLKARLGNGFTFDLRGRKVRRAGTKAYGGSFGFNHAIEIVEPIRQTMSEGDARLTYTRSRLTVEASGRLEAFANDLEALVWDNPKRLNDRTYSGAYVAGDGTSTGQLALYPDNMTVRGGLQVGLQLPRMTAFTGFLSYGRTTQDERWLPFTVNAAILQPDTFPLPGTKTDGKATLFTMDYRLTSRPSRYWSGTLRYRRHEYDNETEEHTFAGYVRLDQAWIPGPITNHPFGHTHATLGADLDVRPTRQLTISGLAERVMRDRTFREATEDHENVLGGKIRYRPVRGLEATASYRRGERRLDAFHLEDYENASGTAFIEQPTLRRFDIADRDQDQATAGIGWSPTERVDLSASYEYLRNEYREDEDFTAVPDTILLEYLGLLDEARRVASAEGTFRLTDRIDVGAVYGWGQIHTNQRSRVSGGTLSQSPDSSWQARLKDWFVFFQPRVEWRPARDWTLGLHYMLERSPGVFRLTNRLGTARDLPGTKYERQGVGAEGWYRVDEGFSLGLRWGWEQFEVDDFASEDVPLLFPTTGALNAIFLGDSIQDYRAHLVALMVRRTF